jgi:hypothetical protein
MTIALRTSYAKYLLTHGCDEIGARLVRTDPGCVRHYSLVFPSNAGDDTSAAFFVLRTTPSSW